MTLLNDYNGRFPLPPEFDSPPLERVSRDSLVTPPLEQAASDRRHFIRRPATLPVEEPAEVVSPETGEVAPTGDGGLPTEETTPLEPPAESLLDAACLPEGTEVEVFFPDAASQLAANAAL